MISFIIDMPTSIRSNRKLLEVIGKCPKLFVKWGAAWCRPCKDLQKAYVALDTKYRNKATFVNADVEVCDDVADMYSIRALPTIVCYKFGRVYKKIEGPDNDGLERFIQSCL